jgi:hypothetical protein
MKKGNKQVLIGMSARSDGLWRPAVHVVHKRQYRKAERLNSFASRIFTPSRCYSPGILHSQFLWAFLETITTLIKLSKLVFNYEADKEDIFGCLADVGWITGHTYVVYGPLCNGGTTVLFESTPIYPDPGRYWETVDRLKINQLYLAPTSLRMLIRYGDSWVKKYSRESLKCLGSGKSINYSNITCV